MTTWRQWNDFATKDYLTRDKVTWAFLGNGPRDFEDPLERSEAPQLIHVEVYNETPAPHQGAVASMADWSKTTVHYANEIFPTATIGRLGTVGLALASLAPGQHLILGSRQWSGYWTSPRMRQAQTTDPPGG